MLSEKNIFKTKYEYVKSSHIKKLNNKQKILNKKKIMLKVKEVFENINIIFLFLLFAIKCVNLINYDQTYK